MRSHRDKVVQNIYANQALFLHEEEELHVIIIDQKSRKKAQERETKKEIIKRKTGNDARNATWLASKFLFLMEYLSNILSCYCIDDPSLFFLLFPLIHSL